MEEKKLERMLEMLEKLVNIDSGSHDKDGVDQIGSYLKNLYIELGFEVKEKKYSKVGNALVLKHKDADNPKILILAHIDTVYPKGSASKRPFTVKDKYAYGPGIIDMKVSLVMLYFAMKELISKNYDIYKQIEIILNGDEQIGTNFSRTIIEERAEEKEYVLVLEPARANGSIVSARRGIGHYELEIEGKAAHCGINPDQGRSAIVELAHKIMKLNSLNDPKTNINVNIGLIEGGEASNTVAPFAKASIDVRFNTYEQGELIDKKIKEICQDSDVPGTRLSLLGGINRPPMILTDKVKGLVDIVLKEAKNIGLDINHTATGGGSDASFTAAMGIPTVDGLGAVGGGQNSEEEYLEIDSLVERTQLLINVLIKLS